MGRRSGRRLLEFTVNMADVDGTCRGGFYTDGSVDGHGCTYVTTDHAGSNHDYCTRCERCEGP
jgi:hypothetical protein